MAPHDKLKENMLNLEYQIEVLQALSQECTPVIVGSARVSQDNRAGEDKFSTINGIWASQKYDAIVLHGTIRYQGNDHVGIEVSSKHEDEVKRTLDELLKASGLEKYFIVGELQTDKAPY